MGLLARMLHLIFLLTCVPMLIAQKDDKLGGLTILEWNNKCRDYFKGSPGSIQQQFQVAGYCEAYVCQKSGNLVGMRVDECPQRSINGKKCALEAVKNLPYPICCKYKCAKK